ncbi:hypothetical protein [Desulfosediminicola sp.]|uniref:hypothetical protein n=1 Tax=Desulfosediminicola sp. TaxID=2886825 RepID=UPI003AF224DC
MKTNELLKVLDMLISFFETGNTVTDSAAKAIFMEDGEYDEYWQGVVDEFRQSVDWTGVRAPESEFLSFCLRNLRDKIDNQG